jgi:hypothetical protein
MYVLLQSFKREFYTKFIEIRQTVSELKRRDNHTSGGRDAVPYKRIYLRLS